MCLTEYRLFYPYYFHYSIHFKQPSVVEMSKTNYLCRSVCMLDDAPLCFSSSSFPFEYHAVYLYSKGLQVSFFKLKLFRDDSIKRATIKKRRRESFAINDKVMKCFWWYRINIVLSSWLSLVTIRKRICYSIVGIENAEKVLIEFYEEKTMATFF